MATPRRKTQSTIPVSQATLYRLPEAAPALLNGTPLLPRSGQRKFAAELSWDLPSLRPGATARIDVAVSGARADDLAEASLVLSTRFIELNAAMWSNNAMWVIARNISATTFDMAAATLSVGGNEAKVAVRILRSDAGVRQHRKLLTRTTLHAHRT